MECAASMTQAPRSVNNVDFQVRKVWGEIANIISCTFLSIVLSSDSIAYSITKNDHYDPSCRGLTVFCATNSCSNPSVELFHRSTSNHSSSPRSVSTDERERRTSKVEKNFSTKVKVKKKTQKYDSTSGNLTVTLSNSHSIPQCK